MKCDKCGAPITFKPDAPFCSPPRYDEDLLERVAESLDWLVADARQRADDCRGNVEIGSAGGYHPKLIEAIELLAELKRGAKDDD